MAADDAGPAYVTRVPRGNAAVVTDGIDWTMPDWVRPADFSGFFSEDASPRDHVQVRSVDVSWKQVSPEPGVIDWKTDERRRGSTSTRWATTLKEPGPYWFRMFASGADWAPRWVIDECGVSSIGTDYDGQDHLPIWDDCVWGHLRDTWALILRGPDGDSGLMADPNFRFAYIPGAFTWSEFDYEMTSSAADSGELTEEHYLAWFRRMVDDFVQIGGDERGRLVFTGEDYPWGPWPSDELLAAEATKAGLGIRNGITEQSNFHLNETPAYGSRILPDGHMQVADDAPPHQPGTVVGTENECFVDCGFSAQDTAYVVAMSNLKALQLRMNWIYVVPGPSLLDQVPEHWDWVRLSMGQQPSTAPDAWAALRDAEDVYWREYTGPFGKDGRAWRGRPFVRNYERWLVQRDVSGAVAHRSDVDVHRGDPTPENGVAHEGLSTDVAAGDRALAFALDPRFLPGPAKVLVKVTFFDAAQGRSGCARQPVAATRCPSAGSRSGARPRSRSSWLPAVTCRGVRTCGSTSSAPATRRSSSSGWCGSARPDARVESHRPRTRAALSR